MCDEYDLAFRLTYKLYNNVFGCIRHFQCFSLDTQVMLLFVLEKSLTKKLKHLKILHQNLPETMFDNLLTISKVAMPFPFLLITENAECKCNINLPTSNGIFLLSYFIFICQSY